jgi:hypothetical protein
MSHWVFLDYCSNDGRNFIQEWYGNLSTTAQADFDLVMYILRATKDWTKRKEYKALTEKHVGLSELRFKTNKVQYRPVGVCKVESREFVFLLGCEKSGRIYRPPNALDSALELKKMFEQGLGEVHESAF